MACCSRFRIRTRLLTRFWTLSVSSSNAAAPLLMRLPVSTSAASHRVFGAPALSFLRHEQIYRPVRAVFAERAQQCSTVPAPSHRLDESAAGYSWASCSPAELGRCEKIGTNLRNTGFAERCLIRAMVRHEFV